MREKITNAFGHEKGSLFVTSPPNQVQHGNEIKIIKIMLIFLTAIFMMVVSPFSGYSHGEEDAPVDSQFFCGYCHILSYPKVIKKAHVSWKTGKHKDVPCAQCHYPPEKYGIKIPEHERIPRDEREELQKKTEIELMKTELEVLSRLVTILNMEESTVVRRSKIDDRSCSSSRCHPTTGKGKKGAYWTEKIEFDEYERDDKSKGIVSFSHEKHYDKEKWVKGDVMHCATCHQRENEKKHFEVSKASCFLCHFGNNKFNEGLSKCALCHEIPEEPLQKQKQEEEKEKDEKPITHESLEEAKVPCWSCHGELVEGRGRVSKEKCLNCHDGEDTIMEKAEDLEIMHKEHVAVKNARCFECHEPIEHKKVDDHYKYAVENCSGCHRNTHIIQKNLLMGAVSKEVDQTPALMHDVKTNCLGCHMKFEHDERGAEVKRAGAKSCVDCHTERHEEMLKEWEDKIKEELDALEEVEKEAQQAIEKAKGNVSEEKMQKMMVMLEKGQKTLNIVKLGNGVHNKKYSIMLIDVAFVYFEDIIDGLGGGAE